MLIFSTISAILSVVLYLLPFIVGYVKKEKMYEITWKGKERVIDNKLVLIAKILLLIVLSIAFIFSFPNKVMFYPVKVAIFTSILVVIMFFTADLINEDIIKTKLGTMALIIWIILLVITFVMSLVGAGTYKNKVYQTPLTFTIESKIEGVNSGGIVFYYKDYGTEEEPDLRFESISINDDNVQIHIIEENEPAHMIIHAQRERYRFMYDKDGKIYPDMEKYSESYDVYISKKELLMK